MDFFFFFSLVSFLIFSHKVTSFLWPPYVKYFEYVLLPSLKYLYVLYLTPSVVQYSIEKTAVTWAYPIGSQPATTLSAQSSSVALSLSLGELLSTNTMFWVDILQLITTVSQKQNYKNQKKARLLHLETFPKLCTWMDWVFFCFDGWHCLCADFCSLNGTSEVSCAQVWGPPLWDLHLCARLMLAITSEDLKRLKKQGKQVDH